MESIKLLSHGDYTKSVKNFAVLQLVKQQEEISNRNKIVEEYMNRLKSLVALTKEGTNLFSEIANNILHLLPGNWGSNIKRVLLIIALIIAVPIIFFILALSCKVFKVICWCYTPVISAINLESVTWEHWPHQVPWVSETKHVVFPIGAYEKRRESRQVWFATIEPHEAVTLRTPRRPSRAPMSRSKVQ